MHSKHKAWDKKFAYLPPKDQSPERRSFDFDMRTFLNLRLALVCGALWLLLLNENSINFSK